MVHRAAGAGCEFPYHREMSIAGQFIAELRRERRSGNVSLETEQHLKHEFRKLGWDATDPTLAAAIGVEIDRLKREAATLHKLRAVLFGVA
jgi:hypothetical protein